MAWASRLPELWRWKIVPSSAFRNGDYVYAKVRCIVAWRFTYEFGRCLLEGMSREASLLFGGLQLGDTVRKAGLFPRSDTDARTQPPSAQAPRMRREGHPGS